MITGVPTHIAHGINKLGELFGFAVSAYKYIRSGAINNELLKRLIPYTILGSILIRPTFLIMAFLLCIKLIYKTIL